MGPVAPIQSSGLLGPLDKSLPSNSELLQSYKQPSFKITFDALGVPDW